MAKIPNWSRNESQENNVTKMAWQHDEKNVGVVVHKNLKPNPEYTYSVFTTPDITKMREPIWTGDDLEKARKTAVKWMRDHPLKGEIK